MGHYEQGPRLHEQKHFRNVAKETLYRSTAQLTGVSWEQANLDGIGAPTGTAVGWDVADIEGAPGPRVV